MAHPPVHGFFGPFRFLSNFHIADVEFEGMIYKSTEHAYQAAKTFSPSEREMVRDAETCAKAKKLGGVIEMRPDWDAVKVDVMYKVNLEKYKHEDLRQKLLATGEAYLEETNGWGDKFWGVCDGEGENMLGQVLMLIRDKLRK